MPPQLIAAVTGRSFRIPNLYRLPPPRGRSRAQINRSLIAGCAAGSSSWPGTRPPPLAPLGPLSPPAPLVARRRRRRVYWGRPALSHLGGPPCPPRRRAPKLKPPLPIRRALSPDQPFRPGHPQPRPLLTAAPLPLPGLWCGVFRGSEHTHNCMGICLKGAQCIAYPRGEHALTLSVFIRFLCV